MLLLNFENFREKRVVAKAERSMANNCGSGTNMPVLILAISNIEDRCQDLLDVVCAPLLV
jgi:hypothetical protein